MQTKQFRASLKESFQSQYKRIEENFGNLTPDQLAFRPDEKTWSVGQCLLHMWMTNDLYLAALSSVVLHTDREEPANQEYKHGWFGARFIDMIGPTGGKNTPVPKALEPEHNKVPSDIVKRLLDQLTGFEEFLIASEGKDLVKTKMRSPISKMVRLRLGDVFKALEQHNERHINQAMRLKRIAPTS